MIKKISYIYKQYILDHPLLVIFSLLAILALSVTNIKNFKLDASADTLILEDDVDLKIFRNTNEKYESYDFMILTLSDSSNNVFFEDTLRLISNLTRELNEIDGVESVTSLTNIPLVTSSQKPLTELINNIPNILSADVDRELAKEEILSSPIYKDLVISSDGRTTAIQIIMEKNQELLNALNERNLLYDEYKSDSSNKFRYLSSKANYEDLLEIEKQNISLLIKKIRLIQKNYSNDRYEVRLGGIPMITDDMITFIRNDLINFGFW